MCIKRVEKNNKKVSKSNKNSSEQTRARCERRSLRGFSTFVKKFVVPQRAIASMAAFWRKIFQQTDPGPLKEFNPQALVCSAFTCKILGTYLLRARQADCCL